MFFKTDTQSCERGEKKGERRKSDKKIQNKLDKHLRHRAVCFQFGTGSQSARTREIQYG